MARFEIEFSKRCKKLQEAAGEYKVLIDLVLSKLTNGFPADIKPIAGEDNTHRIRVGKYRILAAIIGNTVMITKIGPRREVYKQAGKE